MSEEKPLLKSSEKQLDSEIKVESKNVDHCGKCSYWWTVSNLLMAMVGIGELAIPFVMKEAGLLLTLPIVMLVIFTVYYSISLINDLTDQLQLNIHSLSDIARFLPPFFDIIITGFVFLFLITAAASYFLFFIELVQTIACHLQYQSLCREKIIIMQMGLLILVPLCLIPTVTSYRKISLIKNIIILLTFCFGVWFGILNVHEKGFSTENITFFRFSGFSTAFGIISLSIELIGVVFEIRSETQNKDQFQKAFQLTFKIGSLYFLLFPILIYLGFQQNIKEIFLFNFPISSFLGSFAIFSFSVAVLLTYPMQLFPIYILLTEIITGKRNIVRESLNEDENDFTKFMSLKFLLLRLSVSLFIFLLILYFKNFITLLEYVGSIVSSSLIFVFPLFIYEYLFLRLPNLQRNYNKYLNYTLLILGLAVTIFNTIKTIGKGINKI